MLKTVFVLGLLLVFGACHSFSASGNVKQLTVNDFTAVTGIGSGSITKPTIGMFYAPWCGHCKNFIPTFEKFADVAEDLNVVAVDCTQNQPICQQLEVKGYPTILYFSTQNQMVKYQKPRTIEALQAFVGGEHAAVAGVPITFTSVGASGSAGSATGAAASALGGLNVTYLAIAAGVLLSIVLAIIVLKKSSSVAKPAVETPAAARPAASSDRKSKRE